MNKQDARPYDIGDAEELWKRSRKLKGSGFTPQMNRPRDCQRT